MKYLSSFEVIGGFWRFGRILYARTPYSCFYYGQATANKIFWRFYRLTENRSK